MKLSPRAIEKPETLVPFVAVTRLLEHAARDQGIDDLGIRLPATVAQLGTFGRLISQSLTLRDALETAYRSWGDYNSGVRTWLGRRGDRVRLHHQFLHGDARDWGQYAVAALMTYVRFLAAVAGPHWRPLAVGLPLRGLPGLRAVPLLADARIDFGQPWMSVTFAADVLGRPLPRFPGGHTSSPDTAWNGSRPAGDVAGAVEQIVTTMLGDGHPDIRLVAEAVGMSPRTLQRRLQGEGLTFARVVAKARLAEARRLLGDPARKVIDVAFDLGYSDHAHFTRAFERWMGIPPREFRRRAVEGAGPAGLTRWRRAPHRRPPTRAHHGGAPAVPRGRARAGRGGRSARR